MIGREGNAYSLRHNLLISEPQRCAEPTHRGRSAASQPAGGALPVRLMGVFLRTD